MSRLREAAELERTPSLRYTLLLRTTQTLPTPADWSPGRVLVYILDYGILFVAVLWGLFNLESSQLFDFDARIMPRDTRIIRYCCTELYTVRQASACAGPAPRHVHLTLTRVYRISALEQARGRPAVKKADRASTRSSIDKVDAMGAAAFGRLSRGGGAAQEYRKV